jgi:fumarate reductase subunit C
MENLIVNDRIKKSRTPARLDLAQSGTGLVLGLFMWVHMLLVASILLGKGSFNFVAKTMELSFLSSTGHGYPSAVFIAVFCVFTLFIVHAALGVRKFPITWKQHSIIRSQMGMMKHGDTNLWYWQVVTGFIMFFLGSVHLFIMLTHPGQIDPYLSADRVFSSSMWPLYLVLLVCVELHGTIGLYRLCMKWGWFGGKDPVKSRERLQLLKKQATIFFLTLGGLALLVFFIIGWGHSDRAGEPYTKNGHGAVNVEAAAPVKAPAPAEVQAPAQPAHVEAVEEAAEEAEPQETEPATHGEADGADEANDHTTPTKE